MPRTSSTTGDDAGGSVPAGSGPVGLRQIGWVFLRLGCTAFGGPAAHIALMEDEVVQRRGWLSRARFLDMLGAVNLIPGPNSTELALHVGFVQAGVRGLLVAGAAFIGPAAILVTALAWAYVRLGALPPIAAGLYGVKPVVVAIVAQAIWRLSRTAVRTVWTASVAVAAIAAVAAGAHEIPVLAAAAVAGAIAGALVEKRDGGMLAGLVPLPPAGLGAAAAAAGTSMGVGLWPLFLVFLKTGAVLFGSGYVLLAFLRADLIERLHWLTEQQLIDAIAVGQMTPGPVSTAATFIGYVLAGVPGAIVATIGIFLPAFVLVAVSGPIVPRLRRSRIASGLLDAVNAASLALMIVVTWHLGAAAITGWLTAMLGSVAAVVLITTRVGSVWLMAAGALAGLVAQHAIPW